MCIIMFVASLVTVSLVPYDKKGLICNQDDGAYKHVINYHLIHL